MDIKKIEKLNKYIIENQNVLSSELIKSIEKDFELNFTHDSTKIEGNTLTIFEVKTVLEDNISIGGKNLREIFEVINNQKAYNYIKKLALNNEELTEDIIKDIHEIITENIFQGGIYRNTNVRITGASFSPPNYIKVREEMKNFIADYNKYKEILNPIELSSYIHAEFVRIHPFTDGNGRTARLLMNYCLLKNNYKPITISPEEKIKYYISLDNYGKDNKLENLKDFSALIYKNEEKVLLEYKKEIKNIIENDKNFETDFD